MGSEKMGRKASVASPSGMRRKSSAASGSPASPRGDDMMRTFMEFKKPGPQGAIQIMEDLNVKITEDEVAEIREKSSRDGELDFELFQEVVNNFIDEYEREEEKRNQTKYKRTQSMKAKGGLDPVAMQRLNEPIPKGKENVRVVTRVRPFMPYEFKKAKELGQTMEPVVYMTQKECQLLNTETGEANHSFKFDQCFWSIPEDQHPSQMPYASQQDLFEYTGIPAIQHAFTGFNTCIFAYGQTGSGKTHSMLGSSEDPGIAPRLVEMLFSRVRELQEKGEKTKFEVRVCFLEIYNEKVMDLLMEKKRDQGDGSYRECKVRNSPDKGTFVDGITRLVCTDAGQTMRAMQAGMKHRAVASHSLNSQSSRSHGIFQICLKQTFLLGTTRVSTINIVDLAGSERVKMTHASGSVLDEAKNINKSLSTLRRVIDTLLENSKTRGKKIPPYRDSMLTWVLKDSLGGNSKTVMLAAISPHFSNYEDTLNTLRYALKAKSIVLHARVNEEQTSAMVVQLKKQLEELRAQQASGGGEVNEELKEELEELKKTEEEFRKKAESDLKEKDHQVKEEKRNRFAAVFRNAFAIERRRLDSENLIAAKDSEIEEMKLQVAAAQKEMSVIKDRANENSAAAKVRAQRDADTIEELQENMEQAERRVEETKSQLEMSRMQTRKEAIRADSVQAQVDGLKAELSRLSNYSKDEVEKLKKENERLRGVEKENTRLRLDLTDHEADYQKLMKRNRQLEEDLSNARKQIEKLLDEKAELRSALAELQDVNSRKQEEMQKLKMEGEREVHILEVELEQKESLTKCMREEVRQMQQELDRNIEEKRKIEESMSVLRSAQSKTHASLVLNANELEEQRQQIKELERINAQTRQELDAAHAQLSTQSSTMLTGSPQGVSGQFSTPARGYGGADLDLKGYMEEKFFPKGDLRSGDMQRISPASNRVPGERVWVSNGYAYGPKPHTGPGSPARRSGSISVSDRDSHASPRVVRSRASPTVSSPRSNPRLLR